MVKKFQARFKLPNAELQKANLSRFFGFKFFLNLETQKKYFTFDLGNENLLKIQQSLIFDKIKMTNSK